jgi:heme-degrading monooxygenase HmoA
MVVPGSVAKSRGGASQVEADAASGWVRPRRTCSLPRARSIRPGWAALRLAEKCNANAGSGTMIAVIFEVEMKDGQGGRYFDLAASLRPELDKIDGFISVERFESLTNKGKYVSLSFWRDEEAVKAWRAHGGHKAVQALGKAEIFKDFRIRVASVLRDYGTKDWAAGAAPPRAAADAPR